MKPFEFELESVLRLKQQLVNQTERKLALAAAEKQRIVRMIDQWKQEIVDANGQVKTQSSRSANATWHNAMRRVAVLEQQVADGREQLDSATQVWRTVCDEYTRLASEAETIARMRDSKWQVYLRESEAEEQRDLDELVLQRLGRRNENPQDECRAMKLSPSPQEERCEDRLEERRLSSRS